MVKLYRCDRCNKEFRDFSKITHLYEKNNPMLPWGRDKHFGDLCHECLMAYYDWRNSWAKL